ncbi:hypothetical protein Hanom_Chr14g01281771 [Helianthus anomalus]
MVIWSIKDEDASVQKSKSTEQRKFHGVRLLHKLMDSVLLFQEQGKFHGVRLLQKLMDSVLLFQVCPLCISIRT